MCPMSISARTRQSTWSTDAPEGSITATAKGTRNHGFHHPNPFYGNPPRRHPVTGSKHGHPYEVPFGYPPGGTELACVLGAVHRLRRQRRRASVPHIG